jgi:hypothetical protein
VPSGSIPVIQRRTAVAVSSGPRVRAASVRMASVVARSMPFVAATATRAGGEGGGDHRHVGGGDLPGGVGGGQRGQQVEAAAGAEQGGGVPAGDPAVPGQPGLHRPHAVGVLGVAPVAGGGQPGLQRAELVEGGLQQREGVEQFGVGELGRVEGGQVEGGDLVEQRAQLRHDFHHPSTARTYERRIGGGCDRNRRSADLWTASAAVDGRQRIDAVGG